MKEYSRTSAALAATVVATFSAGLAFAQTAPAVGTDAATPPAAAAPATPAATAPTPAPAPPAAVTPAPAASSTPATTTPSTAADTKEAKPTKRKKRMTRQQEIDHSIESRTVPSRFRSSVPREYQKYIPFEKK
jgi:hypothetical protein